jgi:hypothetical protein
MADVSHAFSFSVFSDGEIYTATLLLELSLQTSNNVADLSFPEKDSTTSVAQMRTVEKLSQK